QGRPRSREKTCKPTAPSTVSAPTAPRPAGGFATWNTPPAARSASSASWTRCARRARPSPTTGKPRPRPPSVSVSGQPDIGARPDPLQTLTHLPCLLVALHGLQAALQAALQAMQRPAIVRKALEVLAEHLLRRGRVPGFQKHIAQVMAYRHRPFRRLAVGQRILQPRPFTQPLD